MGRLFQTFNRVLHEASAVVIDNRLTAKMSDAFSTAVKSTFDVVEQVLKVVNEATRPVNEGAAAKGKSRPGP
jgi:hypothetical protein